MSEAKTDVDVLTSAERHVLSRIVHEGPSARLMFELAYLGPALVLFAIGLWHSSNAAFVSAFSIILAFRVWAIRYELEHGPVLRSALAKVCAKAGAFGPDPGG